MRPRAKHGVAPVQTDIASPKVADRLDWIRLDWRRLWEVARRLRLTGVGAGMGCGGGREEG